MLADVTTLGGPIMATALTPCLERGGTAEDSGHPRIRPDLPRLKLAVRQSAKL